jgi:solute carrier family 25 protein 16
LAVGKNENGVARLPLPLMLAFGAVAGLVGQTLTYPLDIVRRRMQVQGAVLLDHQARGTPAHLRPAMYKSTWECMVGMARQEGVRSLFYGLHINYIKVIPSTALGFMIYDYMKALLLLPNHL